MSIRTVITVGVGLIAVGLGAHEFHNWRNRMPPPVAPISNVQPGIAPIVFMGDSVFYLWTDLCTHFRSCSNVSVGGQTSADMLARFDTDVLARHPATVVIFAGINDLRESHLSVESVAAMAAKARIAGASVVLCEIVPANWSYPRSDDLQITQWNASIATLAQTNHYELIDFHTPLLESGHPNRSAFRPDLVHPNRSGYSLLWESMSKVH